MCVIDVSIDVWHVKLKKKKVLRVIDLMSVRLNEVRVRCELNRSSNKKILMSACDPRL